MHYDTILFDLSGTLVNYRGSVVGWEAMERLGFLAVHELLHSNGHRDRVPHAAVFHTQAFAHLKTAWQDTLVGRRNLHLHELLDEAMQAQGLFLDNDTIQKAVDHYTSAISSRASVSAGAVELLSTLRGQGRKVGLISNTMWPGRAHHADLKRFGLASYLQVEVYSADVGFWKPSRQVFNHALEALGSSADHAVFIGDNPVDDITGARNAGLKAIWIANGEYSSEAGGHADAVIQGLPDVLEWLERWESA